MKISWPERLQKPRERETMSTILAKGAEDHYFVEQFKALRSKIEYKADMLKLKVIAVTSAIAGEGKSLTSACLAMNLASGGRKRVLLIDVDLRKSDLARGLSLTAMPGLSEFLAGSVTLAEIVRNSVVPGLNIIPAGTKVPAPGDMLTGEVFQKLIAFLREQYDIVILDTPPVLPVADTLSLREMMDGVIFVYRTGKTPHAMLRQAIEEIGEKKIIGVVLNGVEPQKQRYYAKYYGNYYRSSGGKQAGK